MCLVVNNLSKSYGDQTVLNQVSFVVNPNQRIGLVGPNGVGKSTLLKIITGEIEPDGGTVAYPIDIQIGYLAQTLAAFRDHTIAELIAESMSHLVQLEARMRQLEVQMVGNYALVEEYGEVAEQFERCGGYEMEHRVELVLSGLGIDHIDQRRPVSSLSGGEQSRFGLAVLLLQAPDLLLLDEPTNHLDVTSLNWLETYLQTYHGAMLIVSHDREFLNRVATGVVEIDEFTHGAKSYVGNYDAYLQAKVVEHRRGLEDFERQQEEIKALRHEMKVTSRQVGHNRPPTDGDKFLKYHRKMIVQQTISRRISSAEERLRRIEANAIPTPPEPLRFDPDFDPDALKSRMPLVVSGISKSFGINPVLDGVSFVLGSRSRIMLLGPNGAGKSTLLKILAGQESADSGEVILNPQVQIGYLDQTQERLLSRQTVLAAYCDGLEGEEQQHISVLLSSGLFRYEELRREVRQLSSGQKRKLQIARLIADKANLLLLDEPTNYVSFDVLEALEDALEHFPGPVVAVSHDRRFIERFDGEIWRLQKGKLVQ
jgi:macrolide transport system ATP-binding/permease protein